MDGAAVAGAGHLLDGRHPGWPTWLGPLRVPAGQLEVRPIRLRDASAWSRLRLRDRDYLQQWEPSAPGTWTERNKRWSWLAQWRSLRSLASRGQCLPFAIIVDGAFVGQVTVGNVVRGALRSAWLGYWVSSASAGRGVATGAIALVIDHAFVACGLHRIEATVRPENVASVRVLAKAGFREEGLFRRYLDVAGDWRDHLCFALVSDEVDGGLVRRLVDAGHADYA